MKRRKSDKLPVFPIHRIRAWSGVPIDEKPLCGAAVDFITLNCTVFVSNVTCKECLEIMRVGRKK